MKCKVVRQIVYLIIKVKNSRKCVWSSFIAISPKYLLSLPCICHIEKWSPHFSLVSCSVSSSFCASVDLISVFWNTSFCKSCPSCFLCELCSILASFFSLVVLWKFPVNSYWAFLLLLLLRYTQQQFMNFKHRLHPNLLPTKLFLHPFLVLFSFRQLFLPLLKFYLLKPSVYVVAAHCPSLWSLLFKSFLVPHLRLRPF